MSRHDDNREILHIGLGSAACAVSAHYLNLLGLSVTNASSGVDDSAAADNSSALSFCDPDITHSTNREGIRVPRALLVDHQQQQQPYQEQQQPSVPNDPYSNPTTTTAAAAAAELGITTMPLEFQYQQQPASNLIQSSALWSGGVEQVMANRIPQQSQQVQSQQRQHEQQEQWNQLRQTAHQLSYGAHSRYRNPSYNGNAGSNNNNDNRRTIDWDDYLGEEEEEENDEHEDEEERRRREAQDWNHRTVPQLQHQMDAFWEQAFAPTTTVATTATSTTSTTTPAQETNQSENDTDENSRVSHDENLLLSNASWRDFWMPPYQAKSILDLPVVTNYSDNNDNNNATSSSSSSWDKYYPTAHQRNDQFLSNSSSSDSWTQDEFLDGACRHLLEECDSCQGIVVAASGHGAYAGLATLLLQYLQQECPSARRWMWSLEESRQEQQPNEPTDDNNQSWRTRRIAQMRNHLQSGLKWQDYAESAHMILTLQAPSTGTFQATAQIAAALETATLPYRLSTSNNRTIKSKSRVGLNSYYYGSVVGDSPFGTASRLTMSEYLTNLQPSPGLPVLELDTMMNGDNDKKSSTLATHILQGTSLERDQRMRQQQQSGGRPRDVMPGAWMLDASQRQGAESGLLTSLSHATPTDRTVHTHFALAGGLRYQNDDPWKIATSPTPATSSDKYVDCMLQGMGLRYRPESSLAVHLNQDLASLTNGYGAGSYWKHVWKVSSSDGSPVLSVLGNTTRCHGQLAELGAHVKHSLSPSQKGWFQRDVSDGILPEADDCHEILSALYGLRDRYSPPSQDDNDNGTFYDY